MTNNIPLSSFPAHEHIANGIDIITGGLRETDIHDLIREFHALLEENRRYREALRHAEMLTAGGAKTIIQQALNN